MTTTHTESLSNLAANTIYYYRVKSKSSTGIQATSSGYTLKTTNALDITSGLLAAYAFDEGTGNSTADSSGNSRTGSLHNTSWSTDAKFGKALSFNGSNSSSYLSASAAGLPATNAPQTISLWVSLSSRSSATLSVVSLADKTQAVSVQLGFKDSRPGVWQKNTGWLVTGNQLPSRTWNYYAYTFDGKTHRFYFNGTEVSHSTITPQGATVNIMEIGRGLGNAEYFKGILDEVRIYNRALSDAEIHAVMDTAVGGAAK